MITRLIPDAVMQDVCCIEPEILKKNGIRLVLADLDNTLVPYKVLTPTQEVCDWRDKLNECGITLYLLSNSRKPVRVKKFSEDFGIPYHGHSGKPYARSYLKVMKEQGCRPEETIMVGDQIFTDILGAHNAGIKAILVEPIQLAGNPGRYLRYAGEEVFRLIGKTRKLFK